MEYSKNNIKIKSIINHKYEIPLENEIYFKRYLQSSIYSKVTQLDFLKNYDIFGFQDDLLKKFLSVKFKLWNENMKGQNIKVALFDSGIDNKHINCNLIENVNFTNEKNEDFTGHGTFLASVLKLFI